MHSGDQVVAPLEVGTSQIPRSPHEAESDQVSSLRSASYDKRLSKSGPHDHLVIGTVPNERHDQSLKRDEPADA